MNWNIELSRSSIKFIRKNHIDKNDISEVIELLIKKIDNSEPINLDIKKLKGVWHGYHRIRLNKIRIILKIDIDNSIIYIDKIDFRGNVYKK